MKIAVLTGATSGLGYEFLKHISDYYPEIEEFWLVSRNKEKIAEIAEQASRPVKIVALDLTKDESYGLLRREYDMLKPEISLLINNSGCGYLGDVGDGEVEKQIRMIDLNLKGLTAVTHISIPYMKAGSKILNVSSIASFCPNPRMTVYSASKAFVTAFSFGIGEELKKKKITCTVVCPGPMDTAFLTSGGIKGNSKTFETLPYSVPEKVAMGALKATKKGRSVYTPKFFFKIYRFIAKLVPTKLMMKASKT